MRVETRMQTVAERPIERHGVPVRGIALSGETRLTPLCRHVKRLQGGGTLSSGIRRAVLGLAVAALVVLAFLVMTSPPASV